jgi:serine/threonine protein phosphatase 1
MKNNTWVFGDCHGAFKALKQIFERSPIKEGDTIISLGDICDGWSEVYECVELLISMQEKYNMIFLKGNHDDWFNEYLKYGVHPVDFLQGGNGTRDSYNKHLGIGNVPQEHIDFFSKQHLYYKDDQNRLFVHGGFNRHYTLEENKKTPHLFYWDRDLWMSALSYKEMSGLTDDKPKFKIKENLNEIFIGHTTTMNWKTDSYMKAGNIYNVDCGAGFKGRLCILNVDTKEAFYSDEVSQMYNTEKGRN